MRVIRLNQVLQTRLQMNARKLKKCLLCLEGKIDKQMRRSCDCGNLFDINKFKEKCLFERARKFLVHNFSIAKGCKREKERQTFFNRGTGGTQFL